LSRVGSIQALWSRFHTGVITTNLFGEVDLINLAALGILKTNREDVEGNHYEIVFENNKHID